MQVRKVGLEGIDLPNEGNEISYTDIQNVAFFSPLMWKIYPPWQLLHRAGFGKCPVKHESEIFILFKFEEPYYQEKKL